MPEVTNVTPFDLSSIQKGKSLPDIIREQVETLEVGKALLFEHDYNPANFQGNVYKVAKELGWQLKVKNLEGGKTVIIRMS